MAELGRPRDYPTAHDLQIAIKRYFDEITRIVPLKESVIIGYSDKGDPMYEQREVYNALGELVMIEEFVVKPSVVSMAVRLGLTREGLRIYKTYGEDYSDTITHACTKIESYKVDQLDDRNKATNGIIFDLKNNHDYRDKQEIEQTVEHKGVEVSIKVIE